MIKTPAKKKDLVPKKVEETTTSIIEQRIKAEPVQAMTYNRQQIDQIKDVYAKGATDIEFANFILVSVRTGLDIYKRQIYIVPRWDSKLGKNIYTPQTGIDGFRAIAERTGVYAGSDDAIFAGEKVIGEKKVTVPEKATVTVYKMIQGQKCGFTATARWSEYYPGDKQGFMWNTKPHVMLSKCAEALALRKGFPNIGELYLSEELEITQANAPKIDGKTVDKMFEQAKKIILAKKDVITLNDARDAIAESEKYNEQQKAEIIGLIDDRIKELNNDKQPPAGK